MHRVALPVLIVGLPCGARADAWPRDPGSAYVEAAVSRTWETAGATGTAEAEMDDARLYAELGLTEAWTAVAGLPHKSSADGPSGLGDLRLLIRRALGGRTASATASVGLQTPLNDAPELGDGHTELLLQLAIGKGWSGGWLEATLIPAARLTGWHGAIAYAVRGGVRLPSLPWIDLGGDAEWVDTYGISDAFDLSRDLQPRWVLAPRLTARAGAWHIHLRGARSADARRLEVALAWEAAAPAER